MTKLNWGKRYWQFNSMHMLKLLKIFHWYLDDILNRSWQRNLEKSSKSLVKIWKKFLQTYIDLHIVGSKLVHCDLWSIHSYQNNCYYHLPRKLEQKKRRRSFFCFFNMKKKFKFKIYATKLWMNKEEEVVPSEYVRDEAIVKWTNYNLGVGSQRKCQQAIEI